MTERERLEFVVKFLNTDLATIRKGEMSDLQEDIGRFLGLITGSEIARVGHLWICPAAPQDSWQTKDLINMQQELRRLAIAPVPEIQVKNAVSIPSPRIWEDAGNTVKRLRGEYGEYPKPLHLQPAAVAMIDPTTASMIGARFLAKPRDAFVFQSLLLLTQPVVHRSRLQPSAVHLCGRPECGRLFIRTKAQKWCSDRCKNLINQQKRRASLPPEQRKAKYREEYKHKQERKTGAKNLKIGDRRRAI